MLPLSPERWERHEFLQRNVNLMLHFTPTHSSWLNQVEIWFARLEREVIARGMFTSVNDLARKFMRYIRACSRIARPFKWKYTDLRRRIQPPLVPLPELAIGRCDLYAISLENGAWYRWAMLSCDPLPLSRKRDCL